MKLTEAQKRLLVQISNKPRMSVSYYAPARKLAELGLATWVDRRFATRWAILEITQKGKELL